MKQEQLERLCKEWQATLHLQDWHVVAEMKRGYDLSHGDAAGEIRWTLTTKGAWIGVLDPIDHHPNTVRDCDPEQVLVHELLHLHFAPFCAMGEATYEQEQAINQIAWALVELKRLRDKPESLLQRHERLDGGGDRIHVEGPNGKGYVDTIGSDIVVETTDAPSRSYLIAGALQAADEARTADLIRAMTHDELGSLTLEEAYENTIRERIAAFRKADKEAAVFRQRSRCIDPSVKETRPADVATGPIYEGSTYPAPGG